MSEKCEMNGTKCNKDGWVKKKLGEIVQAQIGLTYKPENVSENGVVVLRSSNIQNDKLDFKDIVRVSLNIKEKYYVSPGDILMCSRNGSLKLVGKVAMISKLPESMSFGAFMTIIRSQFNPFLFFFFKSESFREQLLSAQTATINQITIKMLNEMVVYIPSLSEQQHIVSELDCLNGIIEKQKEQLKQLDELAQSIFYDMFGDPVENEKGWDIEQLNDLCTILGGGTPSKRNPEYWNGNIPWVSSKDMKTNYINASQLYITKEGLNNSTTKLIPIGSLLLVNRSGILKHTLPVAINKVEVTINQDIKAFIPNNKVVNTFLMYNLKSYESFLLSQVRAVTADNIELSVIKGLTVPVPPLDLQQAFARKIEAIEHQKELIKQSLAETENLFNSRMDYYFG